MNQRVKSAFIWKFMERIGAQGASFILTIILARLLTPYDYGVVALITVFISLATAFVQAGFNSALIQKKAAKDVDYSSSLLVSVAIAIALYALLFFGAPLIASFYGNSALVEITRVLALVLLPGSINSIQIAKLTREMKFKCLFFASTTATITSALVGIFAAWKGAGPWALVCQQLTCQCLNCILLSPLAKWRWSLNGGIQSIREMLPFGSRILASNLMVTIFLNLRSLIIGKAYTSEDLGFFNRGKQFPQTIMESINGTIQTVLLPVYAQKQGDPETLHRMIRKSVRISNYVIFPMLVGVSCIATPMVTLLLTEKWLLCVPFIQYFAISYMCQPVQIITAQAMRAAGDSKTPLKIEIARKISEIVLLVIAIPISVKAIGVSSAVAGIVSVAIAMKSNTKVLHYAIKEQVNDLGEPIIYSLLMAIVIVPIGRLCSGNLLKILVEICVGVCTYLVASIVFKSKCFDDLKSAVIKK